MDVRLSNRLQKLPPYLFVALRKKIAAARDRGVKVISLGIGDPDQPTPDPVVQEAVRAVLDVADPDRHRSGQDSPARQLAESIRGFYRRRYGVDLSEDQVVPTGGSKDAIALFPMAILDPGDVGIAPMPGYPTYNIGHTFASGVTHYVPLRRENGYLVDFDEIPAEVRRLAKVLWLNYPNNPTTAVASPEFFARAVEFGRKHDVLIAHDAAYAENTYDGYRSPSILQTPGAAEVAVEFFSVSKAFHMSGWRVGAMVGNASAVRGLRLVKDNTDNGTLRAIQFAGAKAFDLAEDITRSVSAVYGRRRDQVVDALNRAGWSLEKPKGTIYVWAPVPEKYHGSSGAFCEDLLERTGVAVTPGLGYGQWGEGFFRISLTYPDAVIAEAVGRIAGMRL
jgi:LL-diaminopimelate aminotransferase